MIDPMPYFIVLVCVGFSLGYLAGRLHPRRARRASSPPVLFEFPRL